MIFDHIPEPIVEQAAPIEHQPLDNAFRHGVIGVGNRKADGGTSKRSDDLGGEARCPDFHASEVRQLADRFLCADDILAVGFEEQHLHIFKFFGFKPFVVLVDHP